MRLCLCLLVWSLALDAQVGVGGRLPTADPNTRPPTSASAPSAPDDLCAISGQVLNAATGEPIKKANLNLQRTDTTPDMMAIPTFYSTSTDASGKFAMKDIEAGRYRLAVNRTGFVSTSYGAKSANRPGTTLTLQKGQSMKDVAFRLLPHSVITGRIVDEDGDPLSYVRVQLLMYRYQQGRKQLSAAGGATTDDLGEYRIFGVAPGKYFLSAMANNQNFMMAQDRSATPQPEEDYVATYYPGTTDVATAAQLDVLPGGLLRGVGLTLTKAHTIRIKGHVNYSLTGKQRVMVYLMPRGNVGNGMMSMRSTQMDAKGDFELRGISPGAYSLAAVINDGSKNYQTRVPLDAGSTNIERLNLTIGPGIEVTGKLRSDGAETADLSNVRLMLQPREIGGMMFGGFSPTRVGDDHSFKVSDVSPGLFNVMVTGLPPGSYVKAIRSEQNDVLLNGLNTEVPPAPLDILISPNASQVNGTVQNRETSKPAPGATIVLVPQEKERKELQTFYKQSTSDQNGGFTFKDVVPGEYRVYAWEDVEYGAYMDPDFMKPLETKGEPLRLSEKDQKALQLTMISAETAGAQPPK